MMVLSVILIFSVIMFGIPLMARVSLVLDSLKGASEPVQSTDASPVLPPRLSVSFEATNSAQISVDGYSNEGNTIEIFVNDKKVGKVVVSKEGTFNFSDIELTEGENTISAIATGTNGKKSSESEPLKVSYKKTPPNLEIESPKDGDSFSKDNKEIKIKGKTDPGSKVYINDRIAILSEDGKFEFNYVLSDGDNTLKIQAIDQAGNKKEVEVKVKYSP